MGGGGSVGANHGERKEQWRLQTAPVRRARRGLPRAPHGARCRGFSFGSPDVKDSPPRHGAAQWTAPPTIPPAGTRRMPSGRVDTSHQPKWARFPTSASAQPARGSSRQSCAPSAPTEAPPLSKQAQLPCRDVCLSCGEPMGRNYRRWRCHGRQRSPGRRRSHGPHGRRQQPYASIPFAVAVPCAAAAPWGATLPWDAASRGAAIRSAPSACAIFRCTARRPAAGSLLRRSRSPPSSKHVHAMRGPPDQAWKVRWRGGNILKRRARSSEAARLARPYHAAAATRARRQGRPAPGLRCLRRAHASEKGCE